MSNAETVEDFALASGEHIRVVKDYFDDSIIYSLSISAGVTEEVSGFITHWRFVVERKKEDAQDLD